MRLFFLMSASLFFLDECVFLKKIFDECFFFLLKAFFFMKAFFFLMKAFFFKKRFFFLEAFFMKAFFFP